MTNIWWLYGYLISCVFVFIALMCMSLSDKISAIIKYLRKQGTEINNENIYKLIEIEQIDGQKCFQLRDLGWMFGVSLCWIPVLFVLSIAIFFEKVLATAAQYLYQKTIKAFTYIILKFQKIDPMPIIEINTIYEKTDKEIVQTDHIKVNEVQLHEN